MRMPSTPGLLGSGMGLETKDWTQHWYKVVGGGGGCWINKSALEPPLVPLGDHVTDLARKRAELRRVLQKPCHNIRPRRRHQVDVRLKRTAQPINNDDADDKRRKVALNPNVVPSNCVKDGHQGVAHMDVFCTGGIVVCVNDLQMGKCCQTGGKRAGWGCNGRGINIGNVVGQWRRQLEKLAMYHLCIPECTENLRNIEQTSTFLTPCSLDSRTRANKQSGIQSTIP